MNDDAAIVAPYSHYLKQDPNVRRIRRRILIRAENQEEYTEADYLQIKSEE
jgi:hypothetical protein